MNRVIPTSLHLEEALHSQLSRLTRIFFFIFRIDMYCEGTVDLNEGIMMLYFKPADTKEKELQKILENASTRYFPVYEKVGSKRKAKVMDVVISEMEHNKQQQQQNSNIYFSTWCRPIGNAGNSPQ